VIILIILGEQYKLWTSRHFIDLRVWIYSVSENSNSNRSVAPDLNS
jgi:hypothetical protein